MNKADSAQQGPMIYGVEAYLSPDYARTESEKLWRKVWQYAGRVEEIPNVGDYITYDILDDSILIVRTASDEIKAFHNVCQHRGRRLVDVSPGARNAHGKTKQFVCGFHGWRWDIHGENAHILDRDDWKGCLTAENTRLTPVNCGTWGGWIWINMDPNCEPLRDYLEPAASLLGPYELEKTRYRWRRWGVFNCNWKVALEAFLEGYHFAGTHPQFLRFADFYSLSYAQGRHSNSNARPRREVAATDSIMRVSRGDARIMTAEMQILYRDGMNAVTTETLFDAAARLVDELPQGTPAEEVVAHWLQSAERADTARGVTWPAMTPEQLEKCGNSWHVFPNLKIIQAPTTTLCHGFRPYGSDPDWCIYECTVIERFPEGQAPQTNWLFTSASDEAWLSVLHQDFSNMAAVQKGMKSGGFRGPRPNPVQERGVTNFHRNLADYMGTDAPRPFV
jgi:phenylpropionate dioxygenase-like ring-hydroxylating dioxygenase large terminal subunit